MKFIQTDYEFKKRGRTTQILEEFEKSDLEKAELIEWENDYEDADKFARNLRNNIRINFSGRIKVCQKGDRIFLEKVQSSEWSYLENEDEEYTKRVNKRFVSIKECCSLTGLSEYCLRNGLRSGLIRSLKSGKKYLIDMMELEKTLEEHGLEFK